MIFKKMRKNTLEKHRLFKYAVNNIKFYLKIGKNYILKKSNI
jgi:hypothetical protein